MVGFISPGNSKKAHCLQEATRPRCPTALSPFRGDEDKVPYPSSLEFVVLSTGTGL